ncbi:hypothetical protein [Streptomyces sp. NPDC060001]|uniref:hypothetical protein n=1 Tax=Streptomyces sp. NPDC060001 TaxID=3347032 RepID=UPI0036AB831F
MRITTAQTTRKTLADLYRAIQNGWAVTVTYTDRDGETTVRTIEPHTIRTNSIRITKTGEVRGGGFTIVAMCRLRHTELQAAAAAGEDVTGKTAERELRLDRVSAYTVHRMAFVLTRAEPTTYERPAPQPIDDEDAIVFYELARDQDDADYRPRVELAQTDLAHAA